uniref:B9 n=1 Tax=Human betaherpesvirus 6 TaxID=10368 RepID=A0A5P9S6V3_9BETA|nr:hypothetical protein [Human betaherpesvirus 6]
MGISVPARAQSDLPKQRRQRLYGNKCPGPSERSPTSQSREGSACMGISVPARAQSDFPMQRKQRLYRNKYPGPSAVRPPKAEKAAPVWE